MFKNLHLHPINVFGYLSAFIGGVVTFATNPATPTVMGGLGVAFPHSHTISVVAAVLTAIGAVAAAVKVQTPATPAK
jgi:hypothetical protein